jgi:hypothetical protein
MLILQMVYVLKKESESNGAFKLGVFGLVDNAHASLT